MLIRDRVENWKMGDSLRRLLKVVHYGHVFGNDAAPVPDSLEDRALACTVRSGEDVDTGGKINSGVTMGLYVFYVDGEYLHLYTSQTA